jgi:hypothetical protein
LWASAPSGPVWLGFAPPPPAAGRNPGNGFPTGSSWKGWKSMSTQVSPSVFLPERWAASASRSRVEPSTSSVALPLYRMASSPLLTRHGRAFFQSNRGIGFPGRPRRSIQQSRGARPWPSGRLLRAQSPPTPGPTWGFQLSGGTIPRHIQRRRPRSRRARMKARPARGGAIPCSQGGTFPWGRERQRRRPCPKRKEALERLATAVVVTRQMLRRHPCKREWAGERRCRALPRHPEPLPNPARQFPRWPGCPQEPDPGQ